MYFPDRGCVHTLLTLYVYATVPTYLQLWVTKHRHSVCVAKVNADRIHCVHGLFVSYFTEYVVCVQLIYKQSHAQFRRNGIKKYTTYAHTVL